MQVLLYNELDTKHIPGFAKWRTFMETGNLQGADLKKVGDNLYRARLNVTDRLLLAFYRHEKERYALVLEYIKNHDYSSSRFLRGTAQVEEDKIPPIEQLPAALPALTYVNLKHCRANILDKVIAFDDEQDVIYQTPLPLVVVGSAGSGKTALTLEKMKTLAGNVLYVSLSPYLVKNARDLYYANGYENEAQSVDFLSFQEFLESIHIPQGTAIVFKAFEAWFNRQPRSTIRDSHKLFEEFKGVLTGFSIETAYLSQETYLKLGMKQSIFLDEERESVYALFTRYLIFLQEQGFYDVNLLSYAYLPKVEPSYDAIVVDEVQDLTNIQLVLLFKTLLNPSQFLLCGDANQIVHPNFFSWSKLKTLFFERKEKHDAELIHVLQVNYRNAPAITEIANRVLLLKNARFGSIDRESHYLVKSCGQLQGQVFFLQDRDNIRQELNAKTRASTEFAVIVMHAEQKQEAQQHFSTPLVFSIQEAKGLEYKNIILYNVVSAEASRFYDISKGVRHEDLQADFTYARTKDKADKSLDVYKFYINTLYVALTRAIANVYWVEANSQLTFLQLLGLQEALDSITLENQASNREAWQKEAHKLALQGKQEHAERIRHEILKEKLPEWEVYDTNTLKTLRGQAIDQGDKKAKLTLFEYALVYEDQQLLRDLLLVQFKPARQPENGIRLLQQKYYALYQTKNPLALRNQWDKFGVDFRNPFNQTPLMVAAWLGKVELVHELQAREANRDFVDNHGFTAFHIALQQASKEPKYAKQALGQIYQRLVPDELSVQVQERLVKLDKRTMEFFLMHLLVAIFYRVLPVRLLCNKSGFTPQDILLASEHFSTNVLPERRKQRAYISSVLSKNEMHRDGLGNRRLFYRVKRGYYLFNPQMKLKIADQWVNIYDLLSLDKLTYRPPAENMAWWARETQEEYDIILAKTCEQLKGQFAALS